MMSHQKTKLITNEGEKMNIQTTFTNNNPKTIYNALKEELGREPSNEELKAKVKAILSNKN